MINRMEQACYKILLNSNTLPKATLDKAYKDSEQSEETFSQRLVKSGLIEESKMLDVYSKSLGVPRASLKNLKVDERVLASVPIKFAWYYKLFPVRLRGRKLTIAVSNLLDVNTLDEIRLSLGFDIGIELAPKSEIDEMLRRYYGLGADTVDKILTKDANETVSSPSSGSAFGAIDELEDIEKLDETASVTNLVNQILLDAYKKRASDIHIEPYRGRIRLRYRIDGVLQEAAVPAGMRKFLQPILSRIKVMANLNTVEKRLPQDGKTQVKTQDQVLDLRISSIPTPLGESMVIRILPKNMVFELDKLGLEPDQLSILKDLIVKPHGILFLTGPTGSGKSTTLYAALNSINAVQRKVITIEDPIEYEMEGMTQIQVMPQVGLSFAASLRSVLRHDPDIMMVGEVRDLETADIAIRIALTGHLILSTLHTNDAAGGITRLLDIGVAPYLVASSVIAFISQRLVRVICPHCKYEVTDTSPAVRRTIARDLGMDTREPIAIYAGKGCDFCQDTGYAGRIAIHEFMVVNDEIRELIRRRAPVNQITKRMRALGMCALRQDGWKKVLKGITTPSEVLEVTPELEAASDNKIVISSVRSEPSESAEKGEMVKPGKSQEHAVPVKHRDIPRSPKERRKYYRVNVRFPISYRVMQFQDTDAHNEVVEQQSKKIEAYTDNFSAGGMCFQSEQLVKHGDVLEVSLFMPDRRPPVEGLARVLRVHPLTTEERSHTTMMFRIAVTFLAISSEERQRIEQYCNGQKENEEV